MVLHGCSTFKVLVSYLISPQVKSRDNGVNTIIFIILYFNNSPHCGLTEYYIHKTTQIPLLIIKVGLQQDFHSMEITRFWIKELKICLNSALSKSKEKLLMY